MKDVQALQMLQFIRPVTTVRTDGAALFGEGFGMSLVATRYGFWIATLQIESSL